jgi:hypothetical protein
MNKWLEYSLATLFISLVASLMYGSYYAGLIKESKLPQYYDDGSGSQQFKQNLPI